MCVCAFRFVKQLYWKLLKVLGQSQSHRKWMRKEPPQAENGIWPRTSKGQNKYFVCVCVCRMESKLNINIDNKLLCAVGFSKSFRNSVCHFSSKFKSLHARLATPGHVMPCMFTFRHSFGKVLRYKATHKSRTNKMLYTVNKYVCAWMWCYSECINVFSDMSFQHICLCPCPRLMPFIRWFRVTTTTIHSTIWTHLQRRKMSEEDL